MTNAFILLFSLLALVFAALVLVLRQPMRAALALVAHMISLAGIYACLEVHVIALFQVLIYVGAVMVFMVYTIMLLDDRDSAYRELYSRMARPAIAVTVAVAGALFWLLSRSTSADMPVAATQPFGFAAFSKAFMSQYWFHFELATILLLVGIVAAWTAIRESR
jgi:NADH-quinone oxidoreductase subunit J